MLTVNHSITSTDNRFNIITMLLKRLLCTAECNKKVELHSLECLTLPAGLGICDFTCGLGMTLGLALIGGLLLAACGGVGCGRSVGVEGLSDC